MVGVAGVPIQASAFLFAAYGPAIIIVDLFGGETGHVHVGAVTLDHVGVAFFECCLGRDEAAVRLNGPIGCLNPFEPLRWGLSFAVWGILSALMAWAEPPLSTNA